MQYEISKWKIKKLIQIFNDGRLNLNPPYQRNFIWTKKDQEELIDSILKSEFPLPTFFLKRLEDGSSFEMVDGQQRTRTIISYYKRHFISKNVKDNFKEKFENYLLPITIILDIGKGESIEEFYARVNKTGRKLNKPELNKAEYFNTNFLSLNEELAGSEEFKSLDLFTEMSMRRMNDIDFVSELVALLEFGLSEKKIKVDFLYENDITDHKMESLKQGFFSIIGKIIQLNFVYQIKKTRYKQRNDFYTLFGFIHKHDYLNISILKYFYKILIMISNDISPSNEFCLPFKEYAINCVSQSNSKKAREKRLLFFEDLFLNKNSSPNAIQNEIIEFYELKGNTISEVGEFYTLNLEKLFDLKSSIKFND